jgi:hypothetical protein
MNKQINLQQEKRQRFLRNLIKEGILNVLVEQDNQQPEVSAVPPATPPPAQQTNVMDPAVTQTPAPATSKPVSDNETFTIDTMVDKLNVLRGAKSFTDPEIFGKLTTFFNELTDEQKTSFNWLLTELVKITDQSPNTPGIQNTVQAPQQGNQAQGAPLTAPASETPSQASVPQSAPAAPIDTV